MGTGTLAGPESSKLLAALLPNVGPACGTGSKMPVVHYLTSDRASWVLHAPCWWDLSVEEFNKAWDGQPPHKPVIKIMGKTIQAPRFQRSFGVDYAFSGQVARAEPLEAEPIVRDVVSVCERIVREWTAGELDAHSSAVPGALLNFYDAAQGHYIGPHSDDEKSLAPGLPVFSVSWGQIRRFRLQPKKHGSTLLLNLAHGDMLVMGGTCQVTHKHELMKARKGEAAAGGPHGTRRINTTVRFFQLAPARDGQNKHGRARRVSERTSAAERTTSPHAEDAALGERPAKLHCSRAAAHKAIGTQ